MFFLTGVGILTLTSLASMSPKPGYPSVLLRCTQCSEAAEETGEEAEGEVREETGEVCGSDWKTYSSQCQLEWEACKRNWNIVQVSEGPCVSQCPDVDLGRLRSKYFSLENVHTFPRHVLRYWNLPGNKQGKLHPRILQVQETFKPTRTGGPGGQGLLPRKVRGQLKIFVNFYFSLDLVNVVSLWSRSLGLTENHSHKSLF